MTLLNELNNNLNKSNASIKVLGVGGGGSNAVKVLGATQLKAENVLKKVEGLFGN